MNAAVPSELADDDVRSVLLPDGRWYAVAPGSYHCEELAGNGLTWTECRFSVLFGDLGEEDGATVEVNVPPLAVSDLDAGEMREKSDAMIVRDAIATLVESVDALARRFI